uniref:Uncharacterized protein n=1 Tax=Anopheles atroparvus TaxID=41427 RepID=A0AAG5D480_ANOAO
MPHTMSSSAWIEELPVRSPVRTPPGPRKPVASRDDSVGSADAFGNISNGQGSVGSGRSGVRRIGDIFRNRLRMAGAAARRSFNESFPQECKLHSDEESSVQTPSPKTNVAATAKGRAFGELVDAVLVNERAVAGGQGRRDRTFTERSNTLAGVGPGSGLRSRRSSTMFRQRTVHRTSSGVSQSVVVEDGAVAEDGTDYGGHQKQQPRKEDTKSKPDDAAPAESRVATDFHRPAQPVPVPMLRSGKPPLAPDGADAMDEVVVGKPPSRERVNSTSHYSTEKSGSSGYYSTNLYSTGGSSVDEHIYCEPIDRCPDGGSKRQPPVVGGGGEEPAGVAPANCDRKRRGKNDQELSELQRNVRGLEQYYYPASLASPAAPQQSLGGGGVAGLEECAGQDLSCGEGNHQLQQTEQHPDQSEQPLSVIMEGIDGQIPRPIWPLDTDDSLMDINLESFRMANHSSQNLIGFESPALSSLTDSEPYASGRERPGNGQGVSGTGEAGHARKKSQYEEFLEFHNTRNILEQIRGKLNTLLEQRNAEQQQQQQQPQQDPGQRVPSAGNPFANSTLVTPQTGETELEKNIAILKADLDGYLRTMNQKNENEIKRFCRGMSREPKVVAVQNAVEQRNRSRSGSIMSLEHDYEMLERSGGTGGGLPYGSVTSVGSDSQLPYYQVMPPMDGEGTKHYPTGRPPAALPTAAALVLNRRSPPNPFAQEVRSCQLFHHGTVGPASLAGSHSLCCQQRYLNSDEIRVCNRYGGCERGGHANVAIDMPDDDGEDVQGRHGDSDEESFAGRGSVSIGMPPMDAGPSSGNGGGDDVRRGSRVKIKPDGEGGKCGDSASDNSAGRAAMGHCDFSQLQRNITLERIILMESLGKSRTGQFGDKEKMLLEWHQNKPSCWELYYGANREEQKPHQTLIRKMKLGRKSTVCISYPSTRPESDFTLDVPRAEQLRLKMKKEKQFRSRCRWFFYFLSVVFFLLSVMVVSLILTRGKRMFGSMI